VIYQQYRDVTGLRFGRRCVDVIDFTPMVAKRKKGPVLSKSIAFQ
jgi:hypothetical protein